MGRNMLHCPSRRAFDTEIWMGEVLEDTRALPSSSALFIKQWNKEQVMPFFGCCTADSQTNKVRHQLYNNGSLVLFSTVWSWLKAAEITKTFSEHFDGP